MSEPKITLKQILERLRSLPTTQDFELASIEFLELSDSEQKAVIFRALVHLSSQNDWLITQLQK